MKPFAHEINYCCPYKVAQCLHHLPYFIWFDTVITENLLWPQGVGRYSYISFDPHQVVQQDDSSQVNTFDVVEGILKSFPMEHDILLPPWQGGVAGYFGYEMNRFIENIQPASKDFLKAPDAMLGVYDFVIAFDHLEKRAWIIATGYPHTDENVRKDHALKRIEEVQRSIHNQTDDAHDQHVLIEKLTTIILKEDYLKDIQKVIDYIYAGDIFQANLSRAFHATITSESSKFFLYSHLRKINPAPFSVYFQADPLYILSSSPEQFLQLFNGRVETRPIKGTRRRDLVNLQFDESIKNELYESSKDKAENLMIVDLMRNDLSKTCAPSTVNVDKLWQLETYATVHQMTSIVSGQLEDQYNPLQLLKTCFPGGSITGAPKVRAMEIIAELEPYKRGPYCGAIGYLSFSGTMDFNIPIRTMVVNEDRLSFNVGGGIVADSDPLEEFIETETKALALIKTLQHFESKEL